MALLYKISMESDQVLGVAKGVSRNPIGKLRLHTMAGIQKANKFSSLGASS
jgi:hypothetical protein